MKFDSKCAPEEGTRIWYLRKGVWLLVKVEMEQQDQELNTFKELIEKIVDAKAKTALRPRFYACETDQYCFPGSRPSTAKAST